MVNTGIILKVLETPWSSKLVSDSKGRRILKGVISKGALSVGGPTDRIKPLESPSPVTVLSCLTVIYKTYFYFSHPATEATAFCSILEYPN